MQVKDVMSAPVVNLTPSSLVPDIVRLLLERRISGVPVLDRNRLVGVVSGSDLLHRHEIGTEASNRVHNWWSRLFGRDSLPTLYVKAHGLRARDIMTRNVIWVTEDAPLTRIAALFESHRIRRLPVLRRGRLVGIVSQADLVRAVGAKSGRDVGECTRSDEAIRARLLDELQRQPWWNGSWSAVYVCDGVVCYRGLVEGDAEKQAARVAAENVAGVREVEDLRVHSADWTPMV